MKKSMKQILQETPRFSSRAAYFSGRGAILCDLDDKILEHIYGEIKSNYGEDAASEYVNMVASMEKCSATDFINNCYMLEGVNFKWNERYSEANGIEIQKNEDGSYNEASAMATMAGMMFGDNNRDQTPAIRNKFLRRHGIDVPQLFAEMKADLEDKLHQWWAEMTTKYRITKL